LWAGALDEKARSTARRLTRIRSRDRRAVTSEGTMAKLLFSAWLALLIPAFAPACLAQHHHPPQDAEIHEKFYTTWYIGTQERTN
jgi:hypothetical protein